MRAFAKNNPSTNSHTSQSHGDNYFGIQAKLSIGKPNDKYEKEADATADKIVSKSNESPSYFGNSNFFPPTTNPSVQKVSENEEQAVEETEQIQEKPLAETLTPVIQLKAEEEIQEKCDDCEAEEKKIQKLPFEDVQEVSDEEQIQTACDSCDKEEQLQHKESTSSPDNNHALSSLNSNIQKFSEDIQKKEDEDIQEQTEEDTDVQKVQMSGGDNASALESNLSNSKGGGSPLSKDTKNEMESGFGTDFSGVRIHNDSNAAQMNKELGAQAFTNGNDIYFNEGKYNPTSNSGKHLLAHELTHTVQQGASVQPKRIQKTGSENATTEVSIPTAPLDITNGLQLSQDWLAYLEANPRQRKFMVPVKIGEQFTGTIALKKLGRSIEGETRKMELNSSRRENYLDVSGMEFLNPLRNAGVHPILVLKSFGEAQQTSGFLSIRKGEEALTRDVLGIIKGINENLEAMSFLGLSPIETAEGLQNEFTSGGLNFNANNLALSVDGYLDAQATIGITNSSFTFDVNATINVAGLAEGELQIARGVDGGLSGNASINADIANVTATIQVEYDQGAVTIQGTGRMNSEKFSGEITFLVTDAAKSQQMMHAALGVTAMDAEAEQTTPTDAAPVPKTKNNQVLAGWGTVQASITSWLEGTANIGIDNEGHVTIVGEIVVPDEIELMEQKGKKTDLFNVEIRAGYGIPLVGQVFLFASVGMFVNAGFGPLVLKNVGFTGTYSTDPNVLQQFSITGTLGINAFAIIGLEAEAGVGVTLIGHDVKAGVNVTAAAGLRAYAEATPTFEYSESQTPEGGKVGESHLKGHFEAAAQLFLQLTGALFYELDSPWWSPAPDGREESPLGEVQYPIGDSLGIGADIDWLVGSPEAPELTFSPVEFDPDKFTADVMADPPPRTMGNADAEPAGEWTPEAGSTQTENPEITGNGEGLPPNSRRAEDLSNLPDEQKYMRALDELSRMENANPKPTISVVEAEIRKIKRKYSITKAETRDQQEDQVAIYVEHARENNSRHLLNIPLMSTAERMRLLQAAMEGLQTESRNATDEAGKITRADAEQVLTTLQRNHPVIADARVVDGENTWDYFIDIGDRQNTETGNLKAEVQAEENTADSPSETPEGEIENIIGLSSPINIDGGHTLKLEGNLNQVEINVYSTKQSLNSLLNDKRQEIHNNRNTDNKYEEKSRAIENLFREKQILGSNIGGYKRAVDNAYSPGHGNVPITTAYNLIRTNLTNIAADLIIVGVLEHTVELPISHVDMETDSKGRSYMLRAAPLSKIPGNTRGSTPTQDPKSWSSIPVSLRRGGAWVRAHLLNHRLHGPGIATNLFPGTRDMNLRDMENQVERFAKEAVWDNNEVIYYNVDVSYGNVGVFEDIPTVVAMRFGPYNVETNTPESATITKQFTQLPPTTATRITINGSSSGALNSKAIAEGGANGTGLSGFFRRLVDGKPSGGYFNIIQVQTIVSSLYNDQNAFMAAFQKFNNLVNTNILEYD